MNKTWKTWADIDGDEVEVIIHYWVQPEERDTNTAFGVELESVESRDGKDLTPKMSTTEIEAAEFRCLEQVQQDGVDAYAARCDWEYDCQKDRQLEERE